MKVYVLTIENEEDCGISTLENLVFSTLEKAKEHFEKVKKAFLNDIVENDDDIIEESDIYFLWYFSLCRKGITLSKST